MNEAQSFFRKSAWMYFFTFLIAPIGYSIKILLTAELSVADIGLFYSVLSLVMLLATYNDLGLTEALNYYLPRYRLDGEEGIRRAKSLLATTVIAQFTSALLIGGLLYMTSGYLSEHFFSTPDAQEVLIGFIPYFFLINIFQVATALFMSYEDPKIPKALDFIRQLATLLGVLWLFFGRSIELSGVLMVFNIGLFIATIGIAFMAIRSFGGTFGGVSGFLWGVTEYKGIAKYSLWVLFTANVGVVLSQVDMQLITYIRGVEDAGYYSMYLSIISIPFMLTGPLLSLYTPMLARYFKAENHSGIQNLYRLFLTYLLLFGMWASIFFFVFSQDLAVALFGQKFALSGDILRMSVLFLCVNLVLQLDFQSLASIGKIEIRAKALIVGLIVNIVFALLLIPPYGVLGASLAVALAWVAIAIIAHRALPFPSRTPLPDIILRGVWGIVIALVLSGALFFFRSFGIVPVFADNRLDSLFLLGIASLLFILAFVSFHMHDIRQMISLVRGR